MKNLFYTLLMSSYLAAGTINTTTMLDKTYHCVQPDEYGLIDLTFIKNGLAHVNPLFDLGFAFEYSVEGNLIFLSGDGESLKLSNATENSFDMFISDDGFITERLFWSCHDNIEDSFTEADATLPTITNSTITIDGIAEGAEWDGMVALDATKTIGNPIDITTMKLAKDSNYIYILLQTDNNISTFMPGTDTNGWIHVLWLSLNEIEMGTTNGIDREWIQAWPEGVSNGIPNTSTTLENEVELVIVGNTVEARYPRSLLQQNQEYISISSAFGADSPSGTSEGSDDYNIDSIETAAWIGSIPNTTNGSTPDITLELNTDNLPGLALFCTGDLFLETLKFKENGEIYLDSFNKKWSEKGDWAATDIDMMTLFTDLDISLTEISSESVRLSNAIEPFSSNCYRTFKKSLDYENTNTDLIPKGTMSIDGTIDGWENTLQITADTMLGDPIDITKINVSKDQDNFYLMFQTDSAIIEFLNAPNQTGYTNTIWITLNEIFEVGINKDSQWFSYVAGDHNFNTLPTSMGITSALNNTVLQASIPRELIGNYLSLIIEAGEYPDGGGESNPIDKEDINFRFEETIKQQIPPSIITYLLN